MRVPTLLGLATLLLALAPALGSAQGAPFDRAIRASVALELAGRRSLDAATARPRVPADALAPRRSRRQATGVTLMLIGGSAVVVGALAGGGGGAVLIVGGAVCAGYGFYLYTE
jgi:hypothetical protein